MQGGQKIANLFKLSNERMWKRYNFADLERDGAEPTERVFPGVERRCSIQQDHVARRRLGMHANLPRAAQTRSLHPRVRPIIWHCRNRRRPAARRKGEGGSVEPAIHN